MSWESGISFVITTKNSATNVGRLLDSILAYASQPYEIIIVDNASDDATLQIGRRSGANVTLGGPERSAQRNIGAKLARYQELFFLDADMELTPNCVRCATERLISADAVNIREVTVGSHLWQRARNLERQAYFGHPLYCAPRLFRRSVFEDLGGYDTDLTGIEDLDLAARLEAGNYRTAWSGVPLLHHEERENPFTYLKKRAYYGITDHRYAVRFPKRWSRQCAILPRFKIITKHARETKELPLLPMIAFFRVAERIIRAVSGSHFSR